ncbi:MAG: sialidase family protein [Pseudomonadota bacterium]
MSKTVWTNPRTVSQGSGWFVNWADFPSVVQLDEDFLAAHWLEKKSGGPYAYDVKLSISKDGGANWSNGFLAHHDKTATEHGFVSLFPMQNGLGAVWLDGRKTIPSQDEDNRAMTLRSGSFSTQGETLSEVELDPRTCDCCQTDAAIVRGNPVIAYRDRDQDEIRDIKLIKHDHGAWSAPQLLHRDDWKIRGCPVNGPAIDARNQLVAVAWFTAPSGQGRVMLALSTDGAENFNETTVVATSGNGRVDVSILPNDSITVLWMGKSQGETASLRIKTFDLNLNIINERVISDVTASRTSGFPQMVSTDEHLVLAWTDVSPEGQWVKTAVLPH